MDCRSGNEVTSFRVLALFTLVLASPGVCFGGDSAEWKARFRAEAPAAWEKYLAFARKLQGSINYKQYTTTGGVTSLKRQGGYEFKQADGAALSIVHMITPEQKDEVTGCNPRYSFRLTRTNPKVGWALTELRVFDNEAAANAGCAELIKKVNRDATTLSLLGYWLPDLLADPDFKIKSAQPIRADGDELVKVAFDYRKPRRASDGRMAISGGWVTLDPQRSWIIRWYGIYPKDMPDLPFRQEFTFAEGRGPFPLLRHSRSSQGGDYLNEADLQIVEQPNVPLPEFTLSAFGLPEPREFTPPPQPRYYLWIAGLAAALAASAFLFRRLARRAEAAKA